MIHTVKEVDLNEQDYSDLPDLEPEFDDDNSLDIWLEDWAELHQDGYQIIGDTDEEEDLPQLREE